MSFSKLDEYMPWGQSSNEYTNECIRYLKRDNSITISYSDEFRQIDIIPVISNIFDRLRKEGYELREEFLIDHLYEGRSVISIIKKPNTKTNSELKVSNIKDYNMFF